MLFDKNKKTATQRGAIAPRERRLDSADERLPAAAATGIPCAAALTREAGATTPLVSKTLNLVFLRR